MAQKALDSTQPKMTSSNSQLASMYGNDFLELVWQNGQILVQTAAGSSCRTRNGSSSCTAEYLINPSRGEEAYVDHEDAVRITKRPRLSSLYPILDFQDYSNPNLDPSLQNLREKINNAHDSCHIDFQYSKTKTSKEHHLADARLMQPEDESAANLRPGKDQSKLNEKAHQLAAFGNSELIYSSNSSRQCPNSAEYMTPRIMDSVSQIPATGGMLVSKLSQKKDYLGSDHQRNGKVNFSHFQRPSVLLKSTYQGNGATQPPADLARFEEIRTCKDIEKPGEASSGKAPDFVVINSVKVSNSLTGIIQDQTALIATKANPIKTLGANNNIHESSFPDEHSEAVRDHRILNQTSNLAANKAKGKPDNTEFCNEPLVACSSVCSLGASNDPTYLSRKHEDTDDSTYFSDNDEEPEGVREVPTREGTRAKRSRNPEVHNLSERKRRDKINKKMRALKELIPNCKKMDKASMLDDAIEYLKALKLQLQIMSMGAGLCMPMMMLLAGAPHMNPTHLPQFPPPMGAAGMGLRPCTISHQFPPTQLGPTPSLTDNRLQMLAAFPNQAVLQPISISHAPFIPMLGKPPSSTQPSILATSPGTAVINPIEHLSSASLTSIKASVPNNSDLIGQPECPKLMPPSNNQASS